MAEQQHIAIEESTGSICCTLLDRRSSVPLHGARINCIGRDNRVMRFDADRTGRFTTKLPQGAYDFVISARGYLSLLVRGVGVLAGHHHIVTRALVPGDGTDSDCDPATAMGGYITDRFGRAVSNVTIKMKTGDGDGAFTTRTERDGAYIFSGVVPQTYVLTVHHGVRRIMREELAIENAKEFVRRDLRLIEL